MVVTVPGNASHSDGGEGSSRASLVNINREPSDGERFPRAVAKVAVAQICESAGFHSIQRSALETLADIAIRYLCEIGKASQLYANLSGRTQSNALDAVAALEDISGASFSDPHILASSSVCVKELVRFVDFGDELPFAKPLPHFPACKTRKRPPSFAQLDEIPPDPHIPPWLPAFPDPQTYVDTPVQNEDKKNAHFDNFQETKKRQKAQVSLRFRLCTSGASTSGDNSTPHTALMGTSPPSASRFTHPEQPEPGKLDSESLHNKAKSGRRPAVCTQNPFLAPPLPEGSVEVSTAFFDDFKLPSPPPSTKKIIAPALPSVLDASRLEAASDNVQESYEASKPGNLPDAKDRSPVSLGFQKWAADKAVAARLSLGKKDSRRERFQMDDDDDDEDGDDAQEILRDDDDAR